jgi:hypothetical protein
MKVKVESLLKVWVAIRNIEKEKSSIKWAYGISKNKNKIQGEIESIGNIEKIVQEIEQERIKYCEDHADKDEKGEPILENGKYKGVKKNSNEIISLIEKTKKAINDYNEILKKEVEIDFYMIDFDDVPKELQLIMKIYQF